MRLLVVSPYALPEGGGQGKVVSKVSMELAGRGHEVTVVSATREGAGEHMEDGVRVIKLKPTFVLSNTPVKLGLFSDLNTVIKKTKPDAVYAHTPVPYFADVAALAARRNRIPLILHYHSGSLIKGHLLLDALAYAYRNTAERVLLSSAKKIIVHNPYIREVTLKDYARKVEVIPPGVDVARFSPPEKHPKKRLLFVGQLISAHRMKGLAHLIEAIKYVKESDDEIMLDIVGGGDMLDFYRSLAKGYGVADKITFYGQVENKVIQKHYQNSSVLALPSYSNAEGFGLVVLEANACGVPAIASNAGGLARVVEDEVNGFLTPPKDPKALAEKILDAFSDEKRLKKMRVKSRKFALKHDWSKVASGVEDCIYSVLEK